MNEQRLLALIDQFLSYSAPDPARTFDFTETYMDLFYDLSDALDLEVSHEKYELFDDINLLCDAYEGDAAIRAAEPYYYDEQQIKEKLEVLRKKLKNLS